MRDSTSPTAEPVNDIYERRKERDFLNPMNAIEVTYNVRVLRQLDVHITALTNCEVIECSEPSWTITVRFVSFILKAFSSNTKPRRLFTAFTVEVLPVVGA